MESYWKKMRIISGLYKGKRIIFTKNNNTRPLRDLVKENIFNIITHSEYLDDNFDKLKILDLFAGFGSFGLECISRGAVNVKFVEKDLETISILKKNLESINNTLQKNTYCLDAIKFLNKEKKNFDIIFLDPPYAFKKEISLINSLIVKKKLLSQNGLLIIHRENDYLEKLEKLKLIDKRNYGRSKLFFYKLI